jgi:chromosome segregation ATPase
LREAVKTLEKSLEDFEHKTAVKEEELLSLSQSHQSLLKSFGEFKIQSQEFQEIEEKKNFKQLLEARKEMNEQVEAYRLELEEKQRALSEMQSRSEELRDELEQVKSINQSFEEYKLRAQKTLKQANATNTSLNSKLTSLEEETETKTAVIDKLTEDLRLSKIEIDRLQNEISELKTQGSEMSESEKELSESQELLKKMTGERDRYKRELEFYVKRIEVTIPFSFNYLSFL